jgi:hypothetical protein
MDITLARMERKVTDNGGDVEKLKKDAKQMVKDGKAPADLDKTQH